MKVSMAQFKVGLSRQAVPFVEEPPIQANSKCIYVFQPVYLFNANFFSTLLLLTLHALTRYYIRN